jgi:hypothetical protein
MNYDCCLKNYLFEKAGIQKRLGGRLTAAPDIFLDEYIFSAKLDKLIIKVEVMNGITGAEGTNFSSVQKVLEKHLSDKNYVEPTTKDNDEKRSCNEFLVTFHDPNIRIIEAALEALDSSFGLRVPPVLHEMEIAVDMISPSISDRIQARDILEKHFLPPEIFGEIFPRLFHTDFQQGGGKSAFPLSWVKDKKRGEDKSTLYFGHKDSVVFWKIYHKVKDEVKKVDGRETFQSIGEDKRSARIEVTLSSEGLKEILGITTVDDFHTVGIKKLKKLFPFSIPTIRELRREGEHQVMMPVNKWRAHQILKGQYEDLGVWSIRHKNHLSIKTGKCNELTSFKELNSKVSEALSDVDRKFMCR